MDVREDLECVRGFGTYYLSSLSAIFIMYTPSNKKTSFIG